MNEIYSLLNDVETNIDFFKKEDLTDIEKRKMKRMVRNKFKKKLNYKRIISVACVTFAILLFTNAIFGSEINAAAQSITSLISDFLGINKVDEELLDYTTVINTSKSDKGYTITLNKVIIDKNEMIVTSTIKSDKPIGNFLFPSADMYVNGNHFYLIGGQESNRLDNYTVELISTCELYNTEDFNAEIDTNTKLNIEIIYNKIQTSGTYNEITGVTNETFVEGNWRFNFFADGKALAKDTYHFPMDESFSLSSEQDVQITEYTSNDLGQKIFFNVSDVLGSYNTDYIMELRGNDDLGNEVKFHLKRLHGENGKGWFCNNSGISTDAKKLTLTLYATKWPSEDFTPIGDEFIIELDNIKK